MRVPMQFTTMLIEDLDLEPGEHDAWVWDYDGRRRTGLGLRMRRGKTGTSKTFYVSYRYAGTNNRMPLGDVTAYTLADARHRAYEIRRDVADGNDPKATKLAKLAKAAASPGAEGSLTWGDMIIVDDLLGEYIAKGGGNAWQARRTRRKIRDWFAATNGERFERFSRRGSLDQSAERI